MSSHTNEQSMNRHAKQTEQAKQSERPQATQSNRQWIRLPEGLTEWLTKRVEFALPVWAVAISGIVVAVLVFD